MDADDESDSDDDEVATSTAFTQFLDFVSTICPSIPHLTYPLLLVIVSTIPRSLLPLSPEPTAQLQTFFSHLWSPVDARLLSTHSLPGQPSAFQAFLQDAIDITTWLIGKAWALENGKSTAQWLTMEQMGQRVWAEGIIETGGKSGRRGGPGRPREVEAERFGAALARLCSISSDLAQLLLPAMGQLLIEKAFDGDDRVLQRSLPMLEAVRSANSEAIVLQGLDQIVSDISARATTQLVKALDDGADASELVNILISITANAPHLIPGDSSLVCLLRFSADF